MSFVSKEKITKISGTWSVVSTNDLWYYLTLFLHLLHGLGLGLAYNIRVQQMTAEIPLEAIEQLAVDSIHKGQWLGEISSLICNFCFSAVARTNVQEIHLRDTLAQQQLARNIPQVSQIMPLPRCRP